MQPTRPRFTDTSSQASAVSAQSSQSASAKTATKDQTPLFPPHNVPRASATSLVSTEGATGEKARSLTTTSATTASPVAASTVDVKPSGNKRASNHPGDKVSVSTKTSGFAKLPVERKKKRLKSRTSSAPSNSATKPSFTIRSGLELAQEDLNQPTPDLLKMVVFTLFAACFASLAQYANYSVSVLELKLGKGKANAELSIMEASMKVLFNYLTTMSEDGVKHARWWPESKLPGKDSVVCIQKAQDAHEAAKPLMEIEAAQSHAALMSVISMLKDMKNGKVLNDLPHNQDTTMAGGKAVKEDVPMVQGNGGNTAAGVDVSGVPSGAGYHTPSTHIGSDLAAGLLPGSTLALILGQGKSSSTPRDASRNSTSSKSPVTKPTQPENHDTAMAVDGHDDSAKPQNFAVLKQKNSSCVKQMVQHLRPPRLRSEGNKMDVDVAGTGIQISSRTLTTISPAFASTPSNSDDAPTESFQPLKSATVDEGMPRMKSWMVRSEGVVETLMKSPKGTTTSSLLTDTKFLKELDYVGERIEQTKTLTCSLKRAIHSKKYRALFRMRRKKVSDMHDVLEKLRIRYDRSAPQALQMAALYSEEFLDVMDAMENERGMTRAQQKAYDAEKWAEIA
ncbi:hypothetical protein LTR78_001871 [Recurvomyces mirabilis]|uniref:Uncharacterized protein n=1 Tax=Recurvomyces mirabilis TaxID=574656 RepID=A0AAE1C583_9PEZI|nr:hypothetical protein LTR78_001871 [Recurvomyces mirabilis]KAK5156689.1 hypothetical protein LTS14_004901 [Recurvomyces mirabilis]